MPGGHGGIWIYTDGAPRSDRLSTRNDSAFRSFKCPHCGVAVHGAVIAEVADVEQDTYYLPSVAWARCTNCHFGVVINKGVLSPAGLEGEDVEGLPVETAQAYAEARRTASAGAFTSCELMCRKILMHVAVDKGADTNKNFAHYVGYLEEHGFITPPMKPWVEIIRQRGNEATHEIPASTEDKALGSLAFTTQLLRLVYEMEHRASQYMPKPSS